MTTKRPKPKPAPLRTTDRAPTLNACLADLRDRISCNRLDVSPDLVRLGDVIDAIESHCTDARSAGNEPHHLDPSVASDAREQFYAIAAWAVSAALHLDRLSVAHRSKSP
jgi:hypothetical protein